MKDFITVNDGEFLHISAVKRLRHITDEERESLAKLGKNVNADRFNTRIDESNSKSYAPETIDEIAAQGVALIQIDEGAFVPRDNIGRVKLITDKDRAAFQDRTGRTMSNEFRSRIETKAGMVLSRAEPATIMQRMGQPYQARDMQTPEPQDMAQARDAVMSKAKTKPRSNGRQRSPEPQN